MQPLIYVYLSSRLTQTKGHKRLNGSELKILWTIQDECAELTDVQRIEPVVIVLWKQTKIKKTEVNVNQPHKQPEVSCIDAYLFLGKLLRAR